LDNSSTEAAAPVAGRERIVALDLMRGIAVLGILLANVVAFGHVDLAYYWPPALPGGGHAADRWLWLTHFVLVDGKFRGLFTILFGAGMVLFFERMGQEDRAIFLQLRRLALLALIGLIHFFLLFHGDILFGYAVAGAFALIAIRLPAEKLLALGAIWALVGAAFGALAYLTPALIEAGIDPASDQIRSYYAAHWEAQLAEAARQGLIMREGSYGDVLAHRANEESGLLAFYASFGFFETIPLMLLGMGLYRSSAFSSPDGRVALAWGAAALGLLFNLALGLWVMAHDFAPYVTQLAFFGLSGIANLPLLVGGAVLLARWAGQPRRAAQAGWLVDRLTLSGRMALSNYVGTSLLMMLVFQGWAGGLYGQLHRAELLLVVLLGWAAMLTFSRVWLARFRQGPLEWAWRCLTYGRRFPNRISPE
jgi:uncharacterized protein